MDLSEKLRKVMENQKKALEETVEALKDADTDALLSGNQAMKKELEILRKEAAELSAKVNKLSAENLSVRSALNEQILDERLSILKVTQDKINLYFNNNENPPKNRLLEFEKDSRKKAEEINRRISQELTVEEIEYQKKLERLSAEIDQRVRELREKIIEQERRYKEEVALGISAMADEKLDEKVIQERIKRNKIEMKIGLSFFNKAGFVLILLGVGLFARWGYQYINGYIKGILSFLLGALFLAAGEFLYRRGKRDVFSMGLIGGGIAVLYSAVFYSVFLLKIIDMNAALLLSVLITSIVLALSVRYDSQTVLCFGLIGGFLPFITWIFTNGFSGNGYTAGMIYLLIVNLAVLVIALWKQWNIPNYLSFVLNVPAVIYLAFNCPWAGTGLIYAALTFIIYFGAVLIRPVWKKASLSNPGLILLGLNATVSAAVIYGLFDRLGWNDFRGYFAVLFCVIYAAGGLLLKKLSPEDKKPVALFYITALTFAVLAIPFQFGRAWISMGWLTEGVLLIVYGYRRKILLWERAGWIVTGLMLFSFFFIDWLGWFLLVPEQFFFLKYALVTLGVWIVTINYQLAMNRSEFSEISFRGKLTRAVKYFTAVNFVIFLLYAAHTGLDKLFNAILYSGGLESFFRWAVYAAVFLALGLAYCRVKLTFDRAMKNIGTVLSVIGDIICFTMILFTPVLPMEDISIGLKTAAVMVMAVYNVMAAVNIRSLVKRFFMEQKISLEYLPLFVGILLFGNITVYMAVQFNLSDVNLILSFLYLVLAVGSILYGFWKKYVYIRYYGLGLTVFALAKLFLFDLRFLKYPANLAAYFGFGVALIGISLIYQKIQNKLEAKNDKE